VLDVPIVPAP